MTFIGPLLRVKPPRASGRLVSKAKPEDRSPMTGKRGADKVPRLTNVTPEIVATLSELYAERLVLMQAYSAEAVGARLGVSKSTVWKIWSRLKRSPA